MDNVAVWFSCGVASAVAAKLTLDKYRNVTVLNTPIDEEHPDNRRFLADVETWLGVAIQPCLNPKYNHTSARKIWEQRQFMSSPFGAPCTMELKKAARHHYENIYKPDWHVLGFTADETDRHERFILTERENVLPVLIDAGLTKQDCANIIQGAGIQPPIVYSMASRFGSGYPNANCIGCVKATSPTYWNHVRETLPDVFRDRAEQSRRLGVRLVRYKGRRIFLDELPPDAKGQSMKTMKFECGIFCEEPTNDPNQ